MRFLPNSARKNLMCSFSFLHQQDSNSLFKESIGHMTSLCTWPICNHSMFCSPVLQLARVCVINHVWTQSTIWNDPLLSWLPCRIETIKHQM